MTSKRVRGRIKLDHTERPNVSASGRDYRHGEIAELSEADASILAALGVFVLAEGSEATEDAAEAGKRRITEAESAAAASHARSVMTVFDSLPQEWRERVRNEGDHVIDEYMLTQRSTPLDEIEPERTGRRRRRGPGPEGGVA